MSTPAFDPQSYKARQRDDWGTAAEGWHKWWPVIERTMQPVSDRLLDLARVQTAHRVLDVATGIGEPAITAARRVGSTGRVLATDQSPQMLAIGRDRAEQMGIANIDFREMDAETLDLPAQSFDAILCRCGLMFLPSLREAMAQMRQLLVPGGWLAAAVWGEAAKVPLISLPMSVVQRELAPPPPPPGTPGPFNLSDRTTLERAFADANFTQVETETLAVTIEMSSAEDLVQQTRDVSAPLAALMAQYSEEKQQALWQGIAEAVSGYSGPDGTIRMNNETILVAAQS